MQKIGQYAITGVIECLSGLRIGGSGDLLAIGGVDAGLSFIRDPHTLRPYIPGTSLKGKMRSELEKALGKVQGSDPCRCGGAECVVCRLFGAHMNLRHSLGPARIIVRDATLVGNFTVEQKSSTAIDRGSGTAMNRSLRTEERVAPGAQFALHIGIQVYNTDQKVEFKGQLGREALNSVVQYALYLVQKTGLGAGVSKGSGQIVIRELNARWIPLDRDFHFVKGIEDDEPVSS